MVHHLAAFTDHILNRVYFDFIWLEARLVKSLSKTLKLFHRCFSLPASFLSTVHQLRKSKLDKLYLYKILELFKKILYNYLF